MESGILTSALLLDRGRKYGVFLSQKLAQIVIFKDIAPFADVLMSVLLSSLPTIVCWTKLNIHSQNWEGIWERLTRKRLRGGL